MDTPTLIERTTLDETHVALRVKVRGIAESVAERGGGDMWAEAGRGGLFGPALAAGGGAADPRRAQVVVEELVRAAGTAFGYAEHAMVAAPAVARYAPAALADRWMEPALAGTCRLALTVADPDETFDVTGATLAATRSGGEWVLDGVSAALPHGASADAVLVLAPVAGAAADEGGGLFLVEPGMAGLSLRRPQAGGAPDAVELAFDAARVGPSQVLGEGPDRGAAWAWVRVRQRLFVAVGAMGRAEALFGRALDFAKTRRAGGRPIGAHQEYRFALARMRIEIDITQTLVDEAVDLCAADALDPVTAAEAKLLATGLAARVAEQCGAIHGSADLDPAGPAATALLAARADLVAAGSNESLKELISRACLDDAAP